MENRKVGTAPRPPKSPTRRKPGDFEPQGATKTPPIIDDPPHSAAKHKHQDNEAKGPR